MDNIDVWENKPEIKDNKNPKPAKTQPNFMPFIFPPNLINTLKYYTT